MELTSKTVELRKLTATEGMYLTQVDNTLEERTYTKSVYLGAGEKVENWREATAEEKQAYEAEHARKAEEAYRRAVEGKADEVAE